MTFTSWRGVVGCIKPAVRPGSLEELIRMLPDGVGVIPFFLDIRRGAKDELENAVAAFEPWIERLAREEVDLILPEGAPPFMLLGQKGEAELISKWEEKYKTPIFTSGTNQSRAMRALGVQKFVGASYFGGDINNVFARYFVDSGFDVLGMEGIDVDFDDVNKLSPESVYTYIKKSFLKHPGAQGIYLLGSGWRVLPIIEMLENDLGVPVIHPVVARCWEIQLRLSIRERRPGFGRLLAEMVPG